MKVIPETLYELWVGRKPSLNYLHIWGCPAEAKLYNPHEKKLDPRTISCYFIGYLEKSKGYKFYCPNHYTKIVEMDMAKFLENGIDSGSYESRKMMLSPIEESTSLLIKNFNYIQTSLEMPLLKENTDPIIQQSTHDQENIVHSKLLRHSQRIRKVAILNDYVVYLQEQNFDIKIKDDPMMFSQAIRSVEFDNWLDAMKDEMALMQKNQIQKLVNFPYGVIPIQCK